MYSITNRTSQYPKKENVFVDQNLLHKENEITNSKELIRPPSGPGNYRPAVLPPAAPERNFDPDLNHLKKKNLH